MRFWIVLSRGIRVEGRAAKVSASLTADVKFCEGDL